MKHKLLLSLALAAPVVAVAQTRSVSGRVTSVADGTGLPGTTVLEKGTTNGATTDADGNFRLTVQPGATLVISSIGFATQEVPVGDQSSLTIKLSTSTNVLSETVVVGYGTQAKRDLTGAVTQISSREVENAPVPSFEQAIQGKAAGVFIENSSGKLGQGVKVRVRGTSSVSAGSQPLYVIDGIPIISEDNSGTSAATNPIADLNPNDIESISVLKDASAAAIYGSRASNGVVLITTKRGKSGATRFTVGYQRGSSKPTGKRDYLNSAEYIELMEEGGRNRGGTYLNSRVVPRLTLYAAGNANYRNSGVDTDWQDEAFQNAPFSQYDLAASGGNDKTKFYLSGLYSDQKGIILGNAFEKISGRLNVDHQATDKLLLGINVGLTRTRNERIANDNAFSNPMQIVALSPITPLIDPRTGQPSGALDLTTGNPNTNFPVYYNPILSSIGTDYVATVYRSLGNVFGQYEIVKGLSFRSELGLDILNQEEDQFAGRITSRNSGPNNGDGFNRYVTNARYTTNNFLTYRRTLAEDHSLEVVGGMAYEERRAKANSVSAQQFPSDAYTKITSAALITGGSSSETQSALLSYFARANYAFANKYLVSASFRADRSPRFGKNNQTGYFPAASIGWVVTEESFLRDQTVLSFLKPRVSYGSTGNQDISDFQANAVYTSAAYAGIPGQRPLRLANPDLKWETTNQLDLGVEFGFFNNRLSGEVDLYQKKTKDLLLNVNQPGTTGFTTQFRNVGNLENRGLEFVLNTRNVEGKFTWNTSINASTNRNKVTNLDGQVIEGGFLNRAVEGQPIGVFFGREYAGVDPANGDALFYLNTTNPDGSRNRATTNDYEAAERIVLGNPNPSWTGGVTNTFSFMGIDFGFTFQGVFGNEIYDGSGKFQMANGSNGYDNQTRDQLRRWQKPGDITDVPKAMFFDINGTAGVGESSRYLFTGDYVRLKTVTLGYNLPKSLLEPVHLQSVRVYASGVNMLTFTKYPGWDPEVNADYLSSGTFTAGNISQGNDFYSAPQAKTLTFGINVGF